MESQPVKVTHVKFQQNIFKVCGLHGKIHRWSNETWIYMVKNLIGQLLMQIQTFNKDCEMFCVNTSGNTSTALYKVSFIIH